MYAGQALLLIAFAGAGTEATGHIYRTTLRQPLTREDLAMLAGQDGLTGLPNRTLLRTRLNKGIVQMRRGDTVLAFHCLDLDHFKFNDNLGIPQATHCSSLLPAGSLASCASATRWRV